MDFLRRYKLPLACTFGLIAVLFIFQNATCAGSSDQGGSSSASSSILAQDVSPTATPSVTYSGFTWTPGTWGDLTSPLVHNFLLSGDGGRNSRPSLLVTNSRTLKIKVHPIGSATSGGDKTYAYSCFQLNVSVNGVNQGTLPLSVANERCTPQWSSTQVLDFSSAISEQGSALIYITSPQYDNCFDSKFPLRSGCGMRAIPPEQFVEIGITVQVDGTVMEE